MALMDILEAAQDGRFIANAGAAAGLDEAAARAALGAIGPEIGRALRKRAEDEAAFDALLDMIEDGDGDAFLDDPALLAGAEVAKDGEAILKDLYGSKAMAIAALQPLAGGTGIGKIAPIAAASVLAALARSNAPARLASTQQAADTGGGLLGSIVSAVVEGAIEGAARSLAPKRRRRTYRGYASRRRKPARRRTRRPSLNDIFGGIFGGR